MKLKTDKTSTKELIQKKKDIKRIRIKMKISTTKRAKL
jgi:hypothetical protein